MRITDRGRSVVFTLTAMLLVLAAIEAIDLAVWFLSWVMGVGNVDGG